MMQNRSSSKPVRRRGTAQAAQLPRRGRSRRLCRVCSADTMFYFGPGAASRRIGSLLVDALTPMSVTLSQRSRLSNRGKRGQGKRGHATFSAGFPCPIRSHQRKSKYLRPLPATATCRGVVGNEAGSAFHSAFRILRCLSPLLPWRPWRPLRLRPVCKFHASGARQKSPP